jgi:GntR family transcriptional regulator
MLKDMRRMDRSSKTAQTEKPVGPGTGRRRVSRQLTPPRYQQIVEELRKEIGNDTLKAGDVLPSESDLCERFAVSRHTIREALRALREEGFVETRQGAPSRITKPNALLYTYSVSDVAELLQYATEAKYEIDKTSVVVADDDLAGRLSCRVGSRWLRIEGFRYANQDPVPLCWTEMYIFSEYSGAAVKVGRQTGTVYSFIESMYGVRIDHVDQTLEATPIPVQACKAMNFDGLNLAILIRRVYRLSDGSIPMVALNYHSPARLRLNWTLKRAPNA